MAVLEILKQDNPILRKKSESVNEVNDEIKQIICNLKETLSSCDGVGISAVQVGILKRIIVVSYKEKEYILINPKITMQEGEITEYEGCLSIKEKDYNYIMRKSYKVIFG